jgi:hypothetical protein|tara:strand:+ start:317 stop:538 length:222 start_codon:yes stop_codon:yes gene_type:complete
MHINKIKLLKTLTILFLTTSGMVFIPYIVGYLTQYFSGILSTDYIEIWSFGTVILISLGVLTFLGYIIYVSLD